jgi:hypothetical protein
MRRIRDERNEGNLTNSKEDRDRKMDDKQKERK